MLLFLLLPSCREEFVGAPGSVRPNAPSSYAVYYGSAPQSRFLSGVDWAIVQSTYRPIVTGRTVYFAYLSLGEIDPDTPVANEISQRPGGLDHVTLGYNRFWHSRVADIRKNAVRQALLHQVERDRKQGFGGLFLDTLDSPLEYRREHPVRGSGMRRAMKSFIQTIHASYPALRIVVNRGFGILPEIAPMISGVMFEDFCSRFDETEKTYVPVSAKERDQYLRIIGRARILKPSLVLMALDYDDPKAPRFGVSCGQIARKEGFLHFVSDWNLTMVGAG